MSLQRLLAEGRLRRQPSSSGEVADLFSVAERDLSDGGPDLTTTADYLDACRSKRNTVDYDGIGIATTADVLELIDEAMRLREYVEGWLSEHHPELK